MKKQLMRNTQKGILTGVCAGLGDYFNIPAWVVRLIFIVPVLPFILSFISGVMSIAVYVILAMVLPSKKQLEERDVVEVDYEIVDTVDDDDDIVDCSNDSEEKVGN